jgi:hypothetical protein
MITFLALPMPWLMMPPAYGICLTHNFFHFSNRLTLNHCPGNLCTCGGPCFPH